MVREVVVVFYRLEGGALAVESEVVDRCRVRKEGGEGRDHGEARAQDGDQGDVRWARGDGGACVGVAEGGFVLQNSRIESVFWALLL